MRILGFHNDVDAGAALIVDGRLVGAVNEERFSHKKLHKGFPYESIEWLLGVAGITLNEIDCFVYGWFDGTNGPQVMPAIEARAALSAGVPGAKAIIADRLRFEYETDLRTQGRAMKACDEIGIPKSKISFCEHHVSHAWSAFAPSPFDEALVVTADGRGDYKSLTVSVADANDITEVDWLSTLDSIGYLYSRITHYLGFKPFRHEGKVTGLAAFGDPVKTIGLMDKMITWRDDRIFANLGEWFKPFPTGFSETAIAALQDHSREDIAAGLQVHVEDLLARFVTLKLKQFPHENICLAGGVFANVKINQRILEINGVRNIYVQPNMGDGGLALGGALKVNHDLTGTAKISVPHAFLGPSFERDRILEVLEAETGIRYRPIEDKAQLVSELIQDNKVVGYFDGAMEFGPRALGHRSILFHPKDPSINDWLNARLERTEFMPFAPVVAEELADRCFKGWRRDHVAARYMTVTYDCTDEFIEACPAVCHIDGTARPQIISPDLDADYHAVIKQYFDDTGTLALVNTSFNRHETPIVCTPEDAVAALKRKMIDVLVIDGFVVEAAK